ncbi:hypothetical protein ASU32_19085 [Tsukamurella tyrosinosolvens]|nr:hypothetical protein ASU32_19085 [Tsukamurella tyrosinosolvens]
MTSVRERTVILRGVIRRTRQLLKSDAAYLSVNDLEHGETYIMETDGVHTDAYRRIRMPLGTGILGAVAAGQAAVQTHDYLGDMDMNHVPEIDTTVRAEGIRSILGVPVRVGGRIVAALLIAHRSPVWFDDETVTALEEMAGQTGVAFEHLRLRTELSELRHSMRRTQSATEQQRHELEELLRLDDRLTLAISGAAGLTGLSETLAEFLSAPVGVHDAAGKLIAGTSLLPHEPFRDGDLSASVTASHREQHVVRATVAGRDLSLIAVAAGAELLGVLVSVATVGDREILSRAAIFVSVSLLFEATLQETRNRDGLQLVEELIVGTNVDHTMGARLGARGLRADAPIDVHVCEATGAATPTSLSTAIRTTLEPSASVVAIHHDHVCVLTSTDSEAWRDRAVDQAIKAAGQTALIGIERAVSAADVKRAHDNAEAVVRGLRALGHTHRAADMLDLGIAGIAAGAMAPDAVTTIISRYLGKVITYDQEHGTSLCTTAWEYLEHGGHLTQTAAALHIHTNTVRQRATRIDTILGPTWRTPPTSTDTQFALRLWKLQR